jgi:glutathione synthase/RimK-type ligase-like ATP-grasp enzyme
MILFCGIPSEAPLALAIESAQRQALPYVVLNQRYLDFWDIAITLDAAGPSGLLWVDQNEWPLRDFTGVYARLVDPTTLPENQCRRTTTPDAHARERAAFASELLADWLELSPGRVVNRPSAMLTNISKPFQAQLITEAGFLAPPTLISNDPERVRGFLARHGRIIYKSCSSVRSIVQEWRPGGPNLDRIRNLPTQFQAFVPGVNIRVHVVGDAVIATAIESEATDYRYALSQGFSASMRPTVLPAEIAAKCRRLTTMLGLAFSGIDLKRTSQDEWYCFEVNPSPGYSYFQDQTGQPIAEALVRYLAG